MSAILCPVHFSIILAEKKTQHQLPHQRNRHLLHLVPHEDFWIMMCPQGPHWAGTFMIFVASFCFSYHCPGRLVEVRPPAFRTKRVIEQSDSSATHLKVVSIEKIYEAKSDAGAAGLNRNNRINMNRCCCCCCCCGCRCRCRCCCCCCGWCCSWRTAFSSKPPHLQKSQRLLQRIGLSACPFLNWRCDVSTSTPVFFFCTKIRGFSGGEWALKQIVL